MPGGREDEQNSSLLIFQPLTPVVTFSTPPLLSATTHTASTLSSPLNTPSLNYLFQTYRSFLATTALSPNSLTQVLPFQLYFELARPTNPEYTCAHRCKCTHTHHTKGRSINSLFSQLRAPGQHSSPSPTKPLSHTTKFTWQNSNLNLT